ncbi:hypothetical protein IAT38_000884 [Cryptococcus sp. DSM 104549]
MSDLPKLNRQIVLKERPETGPITDTTFGEQTSDIPELKDGEVFVRIDYASIDPAMRSWMNDVRSYIPPVQIGEIMRALAVGTVLASRSDSFKPGDIAFGLLGWQEYYVGPAEGLEKKQVPEGGRELDHLGLYGLAGLTAYVGMVDIADIKDGDHIMVSGAAGAVGLTATQIALTFPNVKVTAIAGSKEKLDYLKKLGVHNVLNYKNEDFEKKFEETGLINVYFDNVGGKILDMALAQIAPYGRVVACGATSQYNATVPVPIYNTYNIIAMKVTYRGFVVLDHGDRFAEGIEYLSDLAKKGKMDYSYLLKEGLDNCVPALKDLFDGKNLGKTVVRLHPEAN